MSGDCRTLLHPMPGQQFIKPMRGMGGYAREDVGELGLPIDAGGNDHAQEWDPTVAVTLNSLCGRLRRHQGRKSGGTGGAHRPAQ